MPKPQKPVVEPLKAERIQLQQLRQLMEKRPDLLLGGIDVTVGPALLQFSPTDPTKPFTFEELELLTALRATLGKAA